MGSHTILVVEDEPLIAMMLEDFLESLGHSVSATCESVSDALQEAEKGGFDLAILDGEAVPAGGMGIAKQLKDEIYQCPPILVLTGRPQDAWLATWSRAEGAVPHPIDPIQLAEAVTRLLRPRVPAAR